MSKASVAVDDLPVALKQLLGTGGETAPGLDVVPADGGLFCQHALM